MIYRPAKAYINLSSLAHNLRLIKQLAPNSKVLAVIKANGYGHGICRVAQQLSNADGFAVASLDEALLLRQKGFLHRILLLEGLFTAAELPQVLHNRLDLVIHSQYQLEWLLAHRHSVALNVWIKIDTGMHRLGFHPDAVQSVVQSLMESDNSYQLNFMSHFASADELQVHSQAFTQQQIECFKTHCQAWDYKCSLANSAGILHYPESHLDWVRPGILLYGAGVPIKPRHPFKPVMRLESQVIALKWIPAGDFVGYGNRWQAKKDTYVGVIAIGYGDGYPRHAKDGTPVVVNGERVPLIGRVSMDMITVDLSHQVDKVKVGDRAILWGDALLSVDEVAQCADTIGYELLTGITLRVPFIEVNG
ncbi:alanine racemase 1 [Thiosulfatimonas sediminis]|uniref:Alanine racemase n=1 Tax=Thiosulfatimonas sediminis TaxID=2675054 RepID=A0A6F8PVE5_9GAMM|nr:alanine racemase [Thiosulfatimonas sediminis]BBP45978.1 alanine racemase 1 [Thiosulfatimonas sediminis]